ncbi:MAG TPA: SUMF1/EgtB/PvdO family nonheme iron enzyme [Tepidisphaeraceae bacterium]|nr:SUMF1/EgtB/PvdO family nonheme iron enzyme [Tepidisphaeraceae bacterium]
MAIFGRPEFLPQQHRDSIHELAGVRGFDGEFEKSFFVKGTEARDVAPGSPAALLLEVAKIQQQVSRARPAHWAEVHALGLGEKGPFVVVDHYPRTAADLIKAATPLTSRALYRIIMSALKGLRDLQQISGRPHGNLKPSNVLLSPGDPADAHIALTDPAPAGQVARGESKNDLFQIGQLIHELVLHHPFAGAWPVAATRAWTDLGRHGRRWRNLCNRLLNPNPEKRPRRLASVYKRVWRMRPRKPVLLRPVVLLLVLAAIGGAAVTQRERIWNWTNAHLPRRPVAMSQPTESATEKPRQLVVLPQAADAPTTGPTRTLAAESEFLSEYQDRYEKRGWSAPAQYLANLAARFAATAPGDSAARKALGDTESMLKKIEERWASLAGTSNFIGTRARNDPVLLTYPQFLRQSVASVISQPTSTSPLPAILESLDRAAADPAWKSVLAFLQSPDAQKLDHGWLIESSPLHKRFGNKAVASAEDLRVWVAEAKLLEFQRLAASDDPRPRWSARQQISRIRGNDLEKLATLYKDPAEAKAATGPFEQRLNELDKSAANLLTGDLPWSMKNRPTITSSIAEIDQQIARTAEELRGTLAKRQGTLDDMAAREAAVARQKQEAQQFVGKLEALRVSAIPAVQKEWQQQSKPIVDEIRGDATRYTSALGDRAAGIQKRMEILDASFRALPEKLDLKGGAAAWNDRLTGALQSLDAKQQQRFVEDLIAGSRPVSNREPSVDDLKARATEARKSYDEWSGAAAKLFADLNETDRLLGAGYSLDERPQQDRPSARQLLDECQKRDIFTSEAIQTAIVPLIAPIRALERADWQTLVQFAAADHRTGLRVTAWRNLATANVSWPAERENLKQAVSISESLAAAVEKNAPVERRAPLRSEVKRVTEKLWNRFIAKASAPEDITFALSLKEKLAIPPELLDSRTAFNIAIYNARQDLGQTSDEKTRAEAIGRVATSLQAAIDALPAGVRESGDVARLAGALRQSKSGAQRIDFSTLGPTAARAGEGNRIKWNFTYDNATNAVTYTARISKEITPDELEVVFKRVEGENGDVYLSTTEVSVGLFADVITAAEKWRDVAPMLWSYDPRDGDPRPGPRSWEWPRYGKLTQGIRRTNVWLAGNSDHYPDTLATAENRMVLKDENGRPARDLNPSKRQPMQYVSPEAAIYFCDLLGCRLPTPAEWKAAYRVYAKDNWNLRDRTFKILQRWTYGPSVADRFMPDLGIFMPAGEKPTPEIWPESKLLNRPAESDREYSDGVLWFRDVAPAGMQAFNHLVGNVAEMTFENGHLFTIGGSALSPPTRAIDRECEIPNWRSGNKGYSDIGFRLAFPAPPNPSQQLQAILEKQPYLTP